MKVSTLIIGLLVLGGLVTGLYTFLDELVGDDALDVQYDSQYMNTYDNVQNISENMQEDYEEIMNFSTNKGSAYEIITLVPDFLSLVKNAVSLPFNIAIGLVQDTTSLMGLPNWFGGLVGGVLVAMIIFAIGALILRYRYV